MYTHVQTHPKCRLAPSPTCSCGQADQTTDHILQHFLFLFFYTPHTLRHKHAVHGVFRCIIRGQSSSSSSLHYRLNTGTHSLAMSHLSMSDTGCVVCHDSTTDKKHRNKFRETTFFSDVPSFNRMRQAVVCRDPGKE